VNENTPTISYTAKGSNPPIQLILVIFVALFILFLWLNFVLTQEIESIGREIQARTEELQAAERRLTCGVRSRGCLSPLCTTSRSCSWPLLVCSLGGAST